jgi:NAD(P)-dependent dehydrogenase (short-subunit alcohol dehydrogenase family)
LDVADATRAPDAVSEVLDLYGRIDVLVNAAGYALLGGVEETSVAELREIMEVHFFGAAALTTAVLPGMRERGSGAIVQISSMGGRMSFPGVGAYSASKFALEGLSEALAAEVAPFGVRVLIVEPGAFRTGLHRAGSRRETTPLRAYEHVIGPAREQQAAFDGRQPGDPVRAAAAILEALAAKHAPLRLVLGSDAADAIDGSLDASRAEFTKWETVVPSAPAGADQRRSARAAACRYSQ